MNTSIPKHPIINILSMAALGIALLLFCTIPTLAEADDPPAKQPPTLIGRWDLTVSGADGKYPSWLEVQRSGYRTLVGSYVGRFGSARPISKIGSASMPTYTPSSLCRLG